MSPTFFQRLLLPSFLVLAPVADAATITVNAVADTTLYQAHPDSNLGGTSLIAGENNQPSVARALIRFDLAMIPVGATITSASVTIAAVKQANGDFHNPVSSDFNLYQVLVDWGEGSGAAVTGSIAQAGDATWNARHFGSASWSIPGGQFGVDFADTPSATTYVNGLSTFTWGPTGQLVSDVQSWVNNPATNFGLALISNDEALIGTAKRFASREDSGGTLNPGPQLTVSYTNPVPEPGRFLLVAVGCALSLMRRRRPGGIKQTER